MSVLSSKALGLAPESVMKYKNVLIDLDGTILNANRGLFILFTARFLMVRFRKIFGWRTLVPSIKQAIEEMMQNDPRSGMTNFEYLLCLLERSSGKKREDILGPLWDFYRLDYPRLKKFCSPVPGAKSAIEMMRAKGHTLYLATNPIWPRECVELRLQWSGVPLNTFKAITHSENWNCCKPNVEYYRQILQRWDLDPNQCLMIGDSVSKDRPAEKIGINVIILSKRDKMSSWNQIVQEVWESEKVNLLLTTKLVRAWSSNEQRQCRSLLKTVSKLDKVFVKNPTFDSA